MPTSGLPLILLNVAAVLVCVQFVATRGVNVLDPAWAVLIGYSLNYCVRPALLYLGGAWGLVYPGYYPPSILSQGFDGAMVAAMLFLAAFAAGNIPAYRARKAWARVLPDFSLRPAKHPRRYVFLCSLLILVGYAGMHYWLIAINWHGSWLALLSGASRNAALGNILGMGAYEIATQLAGVGWVLYCMFWADRRLRGARHRGAMFFLVGGLATFALFMIVGSRVELAAIVFSPFACYYGLAATGAPDRKVKFNWRRPLGTAVVIALIAGPLGLYLKNNSQGFENDVNLGLSAWDAFETTVVGLHYVQPKQYLYGRTYFEDLVDTYLPRAFFPNKPKRFGTLVAQDVIWPGLVSMPGSFPPGMVMEAYVNGGYFAIILAGFLIGLFCRVVYERLKSGSWFWVCQMALVFPLFASFRSFGGILPEIFIFDAGILACVALFCNLSLREHSHAAACFSWAPDR